MDTAGRANKRMRVPSTAPYDNDPLIQRARRLHDQRLKSSFEGIFEKYSHDFSDVADVINLTSGVIEKDNGHLQSMGQELETRNHTNRMPQRRTRRNLALQHSETSEDELSSPIRSPARGAMSSVPPAGGSSLQYHQHIHNPHGPAHSTAHPPQPNPPLQPPQPTQMGAYDPASIAYLGNSIAFQIASMMAGNRQPQHFLQPPQQFLPQQQYPDMLSQQYFQQQQQQQQQQMQQFAQHPQQYMQQPQQYQHQPQPYPQTSAPPVSQPQRSGEPPPPTDPKWAVPDLPPRPIPNRVRFDDEHLLQSEHHDSDHGMYADEMSEVEDDLHATSSPGARGGQKISRRRDESMTTAQDSFSIADTRLLQKLKLDGRYSWSEIVDFFPEHDLNTCKEKWRKMKQKRRESSQQLPPTPETRKSRTFKKRQSLPNPTISHDNPSMIIDVAIAPPRSASVPRVQKPQVQVEQQPKPTSSSRIIPQPKSKKQPGHDKWYWSREELERLLHLRDHQRLSFEDIANHFEGRTAMALQLRHHRMMRAGEQGKDILHTRHRKDPKSKKGTEKRDRRPEKAGPGSSNDIDLEVEDTWDDSIVETMSRLQSGKDTNKGNHSSRKERSKYNFRRVLTSKDYTVPHNDPYEDIDLTITTQDAGPDSANNNVVQPPTLLAAFRSRIPQPIASPNDNIEKPSDKANGQAVMQRPATAIMSQSASAGKPFAEPPLVATPGKLPQVPRSTANVAAKLSGSSSRASWPGTGKVVTEKSISAERARIRADADAIVAEVLKRATDSSKPRRPKSSSTLTPSAIVTSPQPAVVPNGRPSVPQQTPAQVGKARATAKRTPMTRNQALYQDPALKAATVPRMAAAIPQLASSVVAYSPQSAPQQSRKRKSLSNDDDSEYISPKIARSKMSRMQVAESGFLEDHSSSDELAAGM